MFGREVVILWFFPDFYFFELLQALSERLFFDFFRDDWIHFCSWADDLHGEARQTNAGGSFFCFLE